MSEFEKHQLKQNIEILIDRARFGSENFFTDSKTAASDIFNFLQQEKILSVATLEETMSN